MKDRGFLNGGQKRKEQDRLGPATKDFKHTQKHKHLGGKGLSLSAFASAKSKTAYNPAELRKQREYYRNAKNVKKYRKLLKHLGEGGQANQLQIDTDVLELNQGTEFKRKQKTIEQHSDLSNVNNNRQALPTVTQKVKKANNGYYQKNKGKNGYNQKEKGNNDYSEKHKDKNTLQKLREDFEKQKQEEERLRKEREDAIAAKHEAREKAESKRRDLKSKMCKRTRSGQPIMKFRMEHLLDRIQNSK